MKPFARVLTAIFMIVAFSLLIGLLCTLNVKGQEQGVYQVFLPLVVGGSDQFVPSLGKMLFVTNRDTAVGARGRYCYHIYSMNPDGTDQVQVTSGAFGDCSPVWSPDRTRLAYVIGCEAAPFLPELALIDATGLNYSQRLTINSFTDAMPTWSPDGTHLAFASDRGGSPQIYVMDVTSPTETTVQLTFDPVVKWGPAWSPDGSKIAYYSQQSEIYVMDADGASQVRITSGTMDYSPKWSLDSQEITFFSLRDGTSEVYIMNVDGSDQVQLTDDNTCSNDDKLSCNWASAFSPDGTKIAFSSKRDGHYEIYIMDRDGSNQTRITFGSYNNWNPDW
jgi:Tol biopolymer transport system component